MTSTNAWRVGVLTTGRQDYGILRSTIRALRGDARFAPLVYAGGMHSDVRFGRTVAHIAADGCPVWRELQFLTPEANVVDDASAALRTIGRALQEDHPDALLLVGDRAETLMAGAAASLALVPIVHLHGGEETEGALDNAFRHALTKLSHLHLVSHDAHAQRVLQMGEPPENVVVVGAPGLDHLYRDDLERGDSLRRHLGLDAARPLLLVTVHPTTLAADDDPVFEARAIADAIDGLGGAVVITQPNADAGGAEIRAFWSRWAASRPHVVVRDALGETRYWGLMHEADVMIGNSSSGVIEAPSAGLPVVNVGDRQRGRLRGPGVVDVPPEPSAIRAAIERAVHPGQRSAILAQPPRYLTGAAAPRIIDAVAQWMPRRSMRKVFHSLGDRSAQ